MSRKKRPAVRPLGVSILCKFCKAVSGRINNHGQALKNHAADCLEQMGIARPDKVRARVFIEANRDIILAKIQATPPEVMAKKPRRMPREESISEVAKDSFLDTYAWRALRMKVLIRDGRRCACCGATPATGAVMNVGHIKPRRLYPELALDENNLQVLCHDCNHGKGNWDETDWRNSPDGPGTPSLQ